MDNQGGGEGLRLYAEWLAYYRRAIDKPMSREAARRSWELMTDADRSAWGELARGAGRSRAGE